MIPKPDPALFDTRLVPPRGARENVRLYVLGECPGREESEQGKPFVGIAGRCLDAMIEASGIDYGTLRFFNVVPYRALAEGGKANRNPTDAEIEAYSPLLRADIDKVKPRAILCAGRSAMVGLGIKDAPKVDEARSKTFFYKGIPVYVTYHPSYVNRATRERENWATSPHFRSVVADLKRAYAAREARRPESERVKPPILDVFDPSSLQCLETLFPNPDEVITLDYEASGLNAYHKEFHIAGIGLGSTKDPDSACYIYFYDALRHPLTHGPVPPESIATIERFFRSRKFVVYNAQYECAVTYSQFNGVRLQANDVLAWLRCLCDSGSLKDVAVRRLGAEYWNDDVEEWVESFKGFCAGYARLLEDRLSPFLEAPAKSFGEIVHRLARRAASAAYDQFCSVPWATQNPEETCAFRGDKKKNVAELRSENLSLYRAWKANPSRPFKEALTTLDNGLFVPGPGVLRRYEAFIYQKAASLLRLIGKYYKSSETGDIAAKCFERAMFRIQRGEAEINYADIPLPIVSEYCCRDITSTSLLYHNVKADLEQRGLTKAADYYNRQMFLGFELERSGIAWDDDLAERLHGVYTEAATDDLRSLLLVPRFHQVLNLTDADRLQIATATDLEVLKLFFNPQSNHETTRKRFSDLVVTPRYRFAAMLHALNAELAQASKEAEVAKLYPVLYPIYQAVLGAEVPKKAKLLCNFANCWGALFAKARDRTTPRRANDPDSIVGDLKLFLRYENFALESMDDEHVVEMYSIFRLYFGVDPNDPATWPDEFRWVYYFRHHKKVLKSRNTYISGSVGRESVSVVSGEAIKAGSRLDVALYGERPKSADEVYILRSNFGVCTARTGRWRASVHTVPASSELQDLRISRYKNGIRLHADLSQAEFRVLAVMGRVNSLIEAFKNGEDVHRRVGAGIYGKKPEEITKAERKNSKSVGFGLVYGKTVAGLADELFNGDKKKAREIFDSLFEAFPQIRDFIMESHYQGLNTGRVTNYFGGILDPEMPSWAIDLDPRTKQIIVEEESGPFSREFRLDKDRQEDNYKRRQLAKALRNCQNYRIQCLKYETPVALLDGTSVPIGEMVENPSKEYYGWAVDKTTGRYVPTRLMAAQKTGETRSWIRVTLDDGQAFEFTPEHLMIMNDLTERRCDALKPGDSLCALHLYGEAYKTVTKDTQPSPLSRTYVHQMVADTLIGAPDDFYPGQGKYQVHHRDRNTHNNNPNNLEWLTYGQHSIRHFAETARKSLDLPEDTPDNVALALALKDRNSRRAMDFPEWDRNQREAVAKVVRERISAAGNITGLSKEDFTGCIRESWSRTGDYRKQRLQEGHNKPESIAAHQRAAHKREIKMEPVVARLRRALVYFENNNIPWRVSPTVFDDALSTVPENVFPLQARRKSNAILARGTWDEFCLKATADLEKARRENHKVAKVEFIEYSSPIPTYDLHVPVHHNFAIGRFDDGIFVHNSTSSHLAACAIEQVVRTVNSRRLLAKPDCFTHDSLDFDTPLPEVPTLMREIPRCAEDWIQEEFDIPMAIDFEFGLTGNHMVHVEKPVVDGNSIQCRFSGRKESIDRITERFDRFGVRHDFHVEEEEEALVGTEELFMSRRAFSLDIGKRFTTYTGTANISI